MTRNKLFIILIGCLILAGGIFYLTVERNVERNNDDGAVAWSEANWTGVSDADADSLTENELTIEKIQQEANEEREANLICNSLNLDKNDVKADLKALSGEEIDKIKSVIEYQNVNLDIEISKGEAIEDADLFAKICRSSYGSYYFYEKEQWNAADESLKQSIKDLPEENITLRTLKKLMLKAYSFTNDDHFRVDGTSILEFSGGLKYYCYLEDVYFYEDERGFYTLVDENKWYIVKVGESSNISEYIKPTITENGSLAYSIGVFLRATDSLESTITLSRGEKTNTVSCTYTKSKSLFDNGDSVCENTQAGIYDGYYVLGIRTFEVEPYISEAKKNELEKYPETAKKLKNTSNFIIDSRGNGGGGDTWLEGWYQNYTGTSLKLTINTVCRFSDLTNKADTELYDTSLKYTGIYENKQDGSFAKNKHFFAYLMDKDVGSAGERGILSVKQMENALLIGTNSRGCMLGDGSYTYILPNSKLGVTVGNKAFVEGNCSSDIEGLGWMPDIYVDGYLALDRTIKMFRYYNLEPDDGVQALPAWGEKINRFESLGEA